MKQALYQIQNTYNINLLTQGNLVVSYLRDLMPGEPKAVSRMRIFYESDTHLLIQKYQNNPPDAYTKAVANFVDYAQCNEGIGKQLIEAVFAALKLQWRERECSCIKMQLPNDVSILDAIDETYSGSMCVAYWIRYYENDGKPSQSEYSDCYERGASEGDADCMIMLAEGYANGVEGIDFVLEKNQTKASEWYSKAVKAGHPTALFNFAVIAYNAGDFSQAVNYCTQALNGLTNRPRTNDAQYVLGLCAYHGNGLPQNRKEAAERFMAAMQNKYSSTQNSGRAQKYLEKCIQEGVISESTVIARLGNVWTKATK